MIIGRNNSFRFKQRVLPSAIVRIIIGSFFSLISFILFISTICSFNIVSLVFGILLFIGGTLLLVFGIRAAVVFKKKKTPIYASPSAYVWDPQDPYFTASCQTCKLPFDYQLSDREFRPWYPNGFIVCPYCGNNNRHNAINNTFVPLYPND